MGINICDAALILTQLLYHEGRGEDLVGQLAILQVAQNRVQYEHETICDVVQSPHQFVYGPAPDGTEQEIIVDLYLQGELRAPVWSLDKTHFYSGSKPYWAVADKCHRHGSHTFCMVD